MAITVKRVPIDSSTLPFLVEHDTWEVTRVGLPPANKTATEVKAQTDALSGNPILDRDYGITEFIELEVIE